MKVSVDTTGRSGSLVKHATIYSNDRVTPVSSLTVILDVVQK